MSFSFYALLASSIVCPLYERRVARLSSAPAGRLADGGRVRDVTGVVRPVLIFLYRRHGDVCRQS